MSLDPALQTFLGECQDLLREMEEGLLLLEETPEDLETINALFRAAHTIKGSGGIFGFDPIMAFTHRMENVLSKLRDRELSIDGELIGLLLESRDHVGNLVTRLVAEGGEPDGAMNERDGQLSGRLAVYMGEAPPTASGSAAATPAAASGRRDGLWHLSLRFDADVLRAGLDPLAFVRFLTKLGVVEAVETVADALPPSDEMDPESNYLGFEVAFRGDVERGAIEEVFEFVHDSCEMSVLPPDATAEAYHDLMVRLPEGPERARELLLACGVDPDRSARPAPVEAPEPTVVAETAKADATRSAAPKPTDPPRPPSRPQARNAAAGSSTLRVDAVRLDQLINLVGELVIGVAGADLLARRSGDEDQVEAAEGISRLVEDIRDTALRLRMVPIGETFRRFQRVVRDGARDLGKRIELVTHGDDAELDKVVAERVGDPLLHLVRNSMDHGLETPAERREAGKPEVATLRLGAYYDSGSIVIEVADDGRGLPRAKILARAVERGLIDAPADNGPPINDRDLYRLIFEAGFSTAECISNLSGRGVGMDVVKRNIEALRGTVELESEEGVGCTVRIRLPLTLSIIDGFLLRVGRTPYVVPLDMMVECIELAEYGVDGDDPSPQLEHHDYINLRGEVLPYLRMREVFQDRHGSGEENIVVVRAGGRKAGLVVDELLGETQTVIKPLGRLFHRLQGISGSTILGSGEVALILDVPGLVRRAVESVELENVQETRLH